MGKAFNELFMNMNRIPNIHNRGQKSLESLRVKFNEIVHSEAQEQDRVESTNGSSEQQPEPAVSINEIDRPRTVRRTNKKRAGKTGNNKGK